MQDLHGESEGLVKEERLDLVNDPESTLAYYRENTVLAAYLLSDERRLASALRITRQAAVGVEGEVVLASVEPEVTAPGRTTGRTLLVSGRSWRDDAGVQEAKIAAGTTLSALSTTVAAARAGRSDAPRRGGRAAECQVGPRTVKVFAGQVAFRCGLVGYHHGCLRRRDGAPGSRRLPIIDYRQRLHQPPGLAARIGGAPTRPCSCQRFATLRGFKREPRIGLRGLGSHSLQVARTPDAYPRIRRSVCCDGTAASPSGSKEK